MAIVENNEPYKLFKSWLNEAQNDSGMHEPTACTLATATNKGHPSARIVLLKAFDERGFCFFTNLTSRKGKEIKENPHGALCFYWDKLDRQVRINGKIETVTQKEGDDYFAQRERGSQIGAWASKQSLPMETENDLPNRVKEITDQFRGEAIPRPPFWSGYRIIPNEIEFWEKRPYRLHKRMLFTRQDGNWDISILYP